MDNLIIPRRFKSPNLCFSFQTWISLLHELRNYRSICISVRISSTQQKTKLQYLRIERIFFNNKCYNTIALEMFCVPEFDCFLTIFHLASRLDFVRLNFTVPRKLWLTLSSSEYLYQTYAQHFIQLTSNAESRAQTYKVHSLDIRSQSFCFLVEWQSWKTILSKQKTTFGIKNWNVVKFDEVWPFSVLYHSRQTDRMVRKHAEWFCSA